ncbi:signal peptidase I [Enterococcus sp. HY326]|uniref:signal peptidase I n=1 Tax=Enterococcus sp. HY326 TaxID=2971265 RepID=UPI002240555D|nr:signal peptidase I [Enterococcus sp. HY326]
MTKKIKEVSKKQQIISQQPKRKPSLKSPSSQLERAGFSLSEKGQRKKIKASNDKKKKMQSATTKRTVPQKRRKKKNRKKQRLRKKQIKQIKQNSLYLGLSLLIAFVLFLGIGSLFFSFSKISGFGMVPTVRNGDVVLLQKQAEIQRFDLIVYRQGTQTLIRRVVGLPGETLNYQDDTLYINDEPIIERFIVDEINNAHNNGSLFTEDFRLVDIIGETEIPEDSYFVLGDNREYSLDSRNYGVVEKSQILGKTSIRLLPLDAMESIR